MTAHEIHESATSIAASDVTDLESVTRGDDTSAVAMLQQRIEATEELLHDLRLQFRAAVSRRNALANEIPDVIQQRIEEDESQPGIDYGDL